MFASLKGSLSLNRLLNSKAHFNGLILYKHYTGFANQEHNKTAANKATSIKNIKDTELEKLQKHLLYKSQASWTPELDEKLKKVIPESQYYCWKELTARYFPEFTSVQVYNRSKKIFKAKGKWTDKEVELLKQGVSEFGTQWSKVAKAVGTRNSDQCLNKWYYAKIPGHEASVWTDEEYDILFRSVIKCPGLQLIDGVPDLTNVDWLAVSKSLSNKGPVHCRYHCIYNPSLIDRIREHFKLPLFTKGSWSPEETSQLVASIQKHSTNWLLVSKAIGTRSAAQCELRWRTLKKLLRDKLKGMNSK
ncbi:hypothetical protein DSO57_1028280 [Entomophthora muscae]|uniref:Uncharacterized protein n=1 Tax=Entomophthora muscae TaxID=34485 RepID=A0ACC2RSL8_9FUNG|nr:hypothetical protein DSO57_1028280 [Entomophthora muscae]